LLLADETPPIHQLVTSILKESGSGLTVLSERKLAEAVQEYVDKKDTDAIGRHVQIAVRCVTSSSF
jgi:hypothetical protein